MNRFAATLTLAALSLGASTVTALTTPTAAPQSNSEMARQDASTSAITIELIEQDFTIDINDELRLVYRLTGDLESSADLAPATTTTTTTTTTTSTSTTVPAPPDGQPPEPAAPVGDLTPTTIAPPDTVPPPRVITIDIANFNPITDIDQAARLLGSAARPGSFRGNIDGVRLADARSVIDIVDESTAVVTVTIPTDVGGDDQVSGPDSLEFPAPGLYPIRLQLLVDDNLVGTHGTLVDRRPGPADTRRPFAPVQFAIVTAVDRPGRNPATPNDSSEDALAEVDDIIAAAALIDPPLLASIPPGLLTTAISRTTSATINEIQSETEADSGEMAGAGLLVGDELAALSDIDLDVSSAVAAGLDVQYTQALGRGEDAVIAALSRTPTRLISIVDRPISARGAQLLRTIGVQALLMTPDRYDAVIGGELPDTDRFVNLALPDGSRMPLLLTDPDSNDFSTAAADEALAMATPTEWAIEAVASVVLDHRSQGRTIRRTRVLALDGFEPPDSRLVNAFDAMAATTPDVTVIAPTALIGTTDTQRSPEGAALVLPEIAGPDLTARLANIEATKLSLASTASMIGDDDGRFSNWTARLDALLSTGVTDDEATAEISVVTAESDSIRSSVELPEPFTFTLTGRSDTLPIRLRNTSNERVRVIVNLSSPTLTFPGNDRLVVLRPNDSTDIQVPLRARSNGTSPVSVQLLTPLGEPLGEPVALTARVNSLTGLSQVLTGGFLLMLAAWWIANWRSKRRDLDDDQEREQAH